MKRNFVFTAVSVGSRLLVSALLFVLLARAWGPEQFGTFTFVFSVAAVLMLIVDFGFPTFLLREVAADANQVSKLVAQGLQAKLLLTAVMSTVAASLALVLGQHRLPSALFILLLLSALLLSYSEFCLAPLRALGRYDVETTLSMCGNTLQFVFAGSVAWQGGTPTSVAIAIVGSRLVYLLACWLALARAAPMVSLRPERGGVRSTIQTLWPYGIDSALTSGWNFIDIIAVRVLFDAQVAGLYAAGQRCLQGVVALAPIVGNVTIPGIARQAARQSAGTWRAAAHAGILMAGIGLAFATPMIAFPGQIVGVVFGSEFSELSKWLPWFGAILIVRFSGAAFGVILTAMGLQRKRITGQIMAVGSYVACIALVDILGGGMIYALAALLFATALMGSSYAAQLYLAKRRNWIGVRQPMTE